MNKKDNFIWVVIIGLFTFYITSIQTTAQAIDTIFTATEILDIEVLKYNPGEILIAATGTCVSKSTDYGETWTTALFDTVPNCYDISFNKDNPSIGFLGGVSGLFKTTDGGFNWFNTNQLDDIYFVNVNPHFPNIIFAQGSIDPFLGPYYLYKSMDNGITWQDSLLNRWILDPQFNPENDSIAYGYNNINILKTTDQGGSWEAILTTIPESRFTTLCVDENNPGTLFASKSGFLYKTTNNGDDWISIDSTLRILIPSFKLSSILLDDSISGRLLIGLDEGLFLTEDEGKHWTKIYDGNINLIKADRERPRNIYCITNNARIAIKLLDTFIVTGVNEVKSLLPERFSLFQNYPNPFNPITKIKFTIPSVEASRHSGTVFVQLKIYDVLGSEVAILVNEKKPAGSYEIIFDSGKLSSGVYFYKLQVREPESSSGQSFVDTKKMVLMK